MTLDKLNTLSIAGASDWFSHICAARSWISCMVESRPYSSADSLHDAALKHWHELSGSDYREALAAEPVLKMSTITDEVSADKKLSFNTLNVEYLKKHGFIFITDTHHERSAQEIINELDTRLHIASEKELSTACTHFSHLITQRLHDQLNS